MPCEHDQDALVAAAATGANPQGELRSHLDACPSCCAAFEQEASLFAAIDSGLHALANSEVPPSLLPRVRAVIAETPATARHWLPGFAFAAVAAAFVLVFFFALRPHQPGRNIQAIQTPPSLRPLPPAIGNEASHAPSTLVASANHPESRPRSSAFSRRTHSSQPEVLVPAEEREGYALLLTALQQRFEVSRALATTMDERRDSASGAKPLEIAQLEVKPLENQDSSTLHRTEE